MEQMDFNGDGLVSGETPRRCWTTSPVSGRRSPTPMPQIWTAMEASPLTMPIGSCAA